jgi:NADPH-dependent glutamate synthase beta subunit-like oxidoreductase
MSQPKSKLSRRRLFLGAGTVGAVAAAASLVPGAVQETVATPQAKEPPERGGGYHVTEHVKRYYQTTLV